MDEPMLVEGASLTSSSSDYFTDAQHEKKDEEVTLFVQEIFDPKQELSQAQCAILLQSIIDFSEGKLQAEYMQPARTRELLDKNPRLISALQKAWRTKNYKEIRKSELLTVPKLYDESVGQKKAIEIAWTIQYRGEAPTALWNRIKKAMKQAGQYARYLAIVQSSGTGKSRMIQELGRAHLVIPVNLRKSGEKGYPPTDKMASAYLCGTTSQQEASVHAVAFLMAVFKQTSDVITELRTSHPEGMDYTRIVDLFNKYMSEGMSFDSHGDKRRTFYDKVDSAARKLEGVIREAFATNEGSLEVHQLKSVGICDVFDDLVLALSSGRTSASADRYSSVRAIPRLVVPEADLKPLVILAFDEAHSLAHKDQPWSHFSELRRALRALYDQPLFSLFLTTGNVNVLVPSSRNDLSSRIKNRVFSVSRPFTEVGFDHFAFNDQFDLRVVTSDEHISHFGRPLWSTLYKTGSMDVKSDMIQFAAHKLRSGIPHIPGDSLTGDEKLACLAQRLPIEFHSVTYASMMQEFKLVERHMRILLQLDAGFESLTTVSASEPLLSEAAYWMMYPDTTFKAAETLKSCLDGVTVHKGDRGELLIMLLFTLARDRAIGHPNAYGQPDRRWCSVPDFMKALFKFKPRDTSLKTFADSKIFFNHWVRVHQYAMVNVQYLAQLMRRGAALLCATNQAGIDGIIPYLFKGYTILLKIIGVILWQGKNDSSFTDEPDLSLFEAMDPYALGILNPADKIPIIRIVFALASKAPCFKCVPSKRGFYDFWVGGISPNFCLPVGGDASIWTTLLQATYGWEDIYKRNPDGKADILEEGLRRSMNPGTATDENHWRNWTQFTDERMDEN